jgi:hypothetical protein
LGAIGGSTEGVLRRARGWSSGPRGHFDPYHFPYGLGVGGSLLDGLARLDICHGLIGRFRSLRLDLYLDAIL